MIEAEDYDNLDMVSPFTGADVDLPCVLKDDLDTLAVVLFVKIY